MKTYLEVENFGKIKKARVACNGYSVFVGDNNSGKSYLMQLIYAVGKVISFDDHPNNNFVSIIGKKLSEESRVSLKRKELTLMCNEVNKILYENKDRIVSDTFRKEVRIDSLLLDLDLKDDDEINIGTKEYLYEIPNTQEGNVLKTEMLKSYEITISIGDTITNVISSSVINPLVIANSLIKRIFGMRGALYLPAARAGIQLLYKDFFASRTDNIFNKEVLEDIQLTGPMYDYLRFLQLMTKVKKLDERTESLIKFIENNIIDGQINIGENNEITYSQNNGASDVPLYIASSMITEITPIIECVMDSTYHEQLLIDEIEACMHPKKQREVARLLNRMRNSGCNLIVSTHSDSMASYINNLLIASKKELSEEKLQSIGLNDEDLLRDTDVNFYEFRNNLNGTSEVVELEVNGYPNDGVEFTLFNQNVDRLYDETTKILGVTDDN